ncbi:MAG: MazG family protein [Lachnospiraceae bacterium]|nr:MazG family protein [Lachnospiraceae bacterium]
MYSFEELRSVVAKLRSEHGCPWDREQTFESLKPCLLEEVGEVVEAMEHQDMENLCEELGDVLYLVLLYSQIAGEKGLFTFDNVADGICEKMIRRHPHVFGSARASGPEESLALWNEIKKQEKVKKP